MYDVHTHATCSMQLRPSAAEQPRRLYLHLCYIYLLAILYIYSIILSSLYSIYAPPTRIHVLTYTTYYSLVHPDSQINKRLLTLNVKWTNRSPIADRMSAPRGVRGAWRTKKKGQRTSRRRLREFSKLEARSVYLSAVCEVVQQALLSIGSV